MMGGSEEEGDELWTTRPPQPPPPTAFDSLSMLPLGPSETLASETVGSGTLISVRDMECMLIDVPNLSVCLSVSVCPCLAVTTV